MFQHQQQHGHEKAPAIAGASMIASSFGRDQLVP
jgi:hypothetical protein